MATSIICKKRHLRPDIKVKELINDLQNKGANVFNFNPYSLDGRSIIEFNHTIDPELGIFKEILTFDNIGLVSWKSSINNKEYVIYEGHL